jgi:hypothetical protein
VPDDETTQSQDDGTEDADSDAQHHPVRSIVTVLHPARPTAAPAARAAPSLVVASVRSGR